MALDVVASCGTNCLLIVPARGRAAREFCDKPPVVDAHSAKFRWERLADLIHPAPRRFGPDHPIFRDTNLSIWWAFAQRAWPTLLFIERGGKGIGLWPDAPPRAQAQMGVLAFPGKVTSVGDRLAIADTDHRRVPILAPEGRIVRAIGGRPALADSPFAEAAFNRPRGLPLDGNHLSIADTSNYPTRRSNLSTEQVPPVGGTGVQWSGVMPPGGSAQATAPSSLWDFALRERTFSVAMSGCHQLRAVDFEAETELPVAGAGPEGLEGGPPADAVRARPSGSRGGGRRVFGIDGGANAIRKTERGGDVTTPVREALFAFGDRGDDGVAARLQHPFGMASGGGRCHVAATFKHTTKRLALGAGGIPTLAGTGGAGVADGPVGAAQVNELSRLTIVHDRVVVAATQNHALGVLDWFRRDVSTLEVRR